jgi:hypothetical protein
MGIMFCGEGFPDRPPRTGTYQQPPRKVRRRDRSLSADVEFTSLIQQLYAARRTTQERHLWNQLLQRVQELPPPGN